MDFKNPVFVGAISGLVILLILGIPTALIPTGLYMRMIPTSIFDYVFLFTTAGLAGAYIGLYSIEKSHKDRSSYGMVGGSVGGLFAFGCPICNVLLITLFGSTALLLYFEPFRPILGAISIAILGLMVYMKIKKCAKCIKN